MLESSVVTDAYGKNKLGIWYVGTAGPRGVWTLSASELLNEAKLQEEVKLKKEAELKEEAAA